MVHAGVRLVLLKLSHIHIKLTTHIYKDRHELNAIPVRELIMASDVNLIADPVVLLDEVVDDSEVL